MPERRLFLRRVLLALGLAFAATTAPAQTLPYADTVADGPAAAGASYAPPPAAVDDGEAAQAEAPARRPRRSRARFDPYVEVDQAISAELSSGDTLTYTNLAVGVDGTIETRRVSVAVSYRYDRQIGWNRDAGDQDSHSGLALVHVQAVPRVLAFDAGAFATRTAGQGRFFGPADRDAAIDVYSLFAGPSLATHAGPLAVNAAYRLGYTAIDDHLDGFTLADGFDHSTTHNASASIGMAPGRLPFGWTLGAGYLASSTDSPFDDRFHAAYVRGDVVVPVGPTLALTAGIGYEDIKSSQYDIARNSDGSAVIGPDGLAVVDRTTRVLTYDLHDLIYDGGLIWRPSAHTELQMRAGHRYGGTTVAGSFSHRFNAHYGMNVQVFDTVETFGNLLVNDLSGLPNDFQIRRNPFTGDIGGCAFGSAPGSGGCFDRSLQSIRGATFRIRGASLVVSGNRGLWDMGIGASYVRRDFGQGESSPFVTFGGDEDQSATIYASLGRRLSRVSQVNADIFASWYDTDQPGLGSVTTIGGNIGYTRRLLLDRLQFLAALGLYHSAQDGADSTVASALLGLRYNF
jgi:hypothetical protein